ncbi:MAG: MFS transporter [Acutalibacteraceae bacterium]|nr:MFS transporter [Acutalibacteraceae bacterium]
MNSSVKRLKMACYTSNMSMSVVANLSPLLFLTFRSIYGISFSLLGTLVLINFFTQLGVDLIFSFFSHKFNIKKTLIIMPSLSVIGLWVYALSPVIFPHNVYTGLVIGTIIFSAGSGLAEVLLSPVIAALPSDDPDREMSKLHSVYAWGVVGVVIFATVFLTAFGNDKWQLLAMIFSLVPFTSFILFTKSEIPHMETPEKVSGAVGFLKNKWLWLCVAAIFLGGAAECTMAQWVSGYLEQAMGIPKVRGDIFGVALFSVMLGLGRTLYAKKGKNIEKVLLLSAVGASACYLTAVVTNIPLVGLVACAFTGFCAAMLWPGSLVVATDRFPQGGVFVFAMMAAGGDLGGSVGPQLVGVITDSVIANESALRFAEDLALSPEQLGMKVGMLAGLFFSLCAIPVYYTIRKSKYN